MVVTDTLGLAEAILVYTFAVISLQVAGSAVGGVSDSLLGLVLVRIRNELLLGLYRKK